MKSELSRCAPIGADVGSTIAATEAQAGADPRKAGVNIAGLDFTGYAAARPASPETHEKPNPHRSRSTSNIRRAAATSAV